MEFHFLGFLCSRLKLHVSTFVRCIVQWSTIVRVQRNTVDRQVQCENAIDRGQWTRLNLYR